MNHPTVTPDRCPFCCPIYHTRGGQASYRGGMLPQTDVLLSRALLISIGARHPGLGSGFGINVLDGPHELAASADESCRVVRQYL